jgi:hypothetical protein
VPGFAEAAAVLGEPAGELRAIGFGREGRLFYINGPYDNARSVLSTLERIRGAGNYHYIAAWGSM